ncbi:MAG: DUF1501 domain-containing protein [bacterium]|nr:DUF1501 domain-containing protein [bacterium]
MTHQHNEHSCQEYAELSRRQFLGRTTTIAAATASSPAWLPRVALARPAGSGTRDTFVSIFLRGGQDGLTAVAPYADPDYAPQRPTLAIAPPGMPDGAIDLDGFFGLMPAGAPLLTPYSGGHLLIAHAAGSPDPNLSHFDSQRFMEFAIPNMGGTSTISTGWLARYLDSVAPTGTGDLRALALTNVLPATLAGAPGTLPIPDPANFAFPGNAGTAAARRATIASMYTGADEPLGSSAVSSMATIDLLNAIDFAGYVPANGAVYPTTPFGQGLMSVAAMIKAGIDLEAAHLDLGAWDHHNNQGPLNGVMFTLMDEFSRALEAFYLDMQQDLDKFTLAAMTEFGRRIAENGSAGTDHGFGGVIYLLGGSVDGGRVLADWPGLVGGNGNLDVTTDYRDLLAEILVERMGATDLAAIFPNYTPTFKNVIV